jgi:bla regulator protein blaR1
MNAPTTFSAALALLAGLACSPTARAQSRPNPVYEVASIKPSQPGSRPSIRSVSGSGKLNATNATLKALIGFAYNVRDYQISGGPNWLGSTGYDIVATPEHPVDPTPDNIDYFRAMLRSLLTQRFKLTVSRQTKELPVYALVVAKDGPKFKEVEKWQKGADMRIRGGAGQMIAEKVTMALLAQTLSNIAGRSVVDQTGLTGYYDFKLEWTPDEIGQPAPVVLEPRDRPSIFTALQEQLGLKLDSQKGPVEILVIDHAEKASEN